MKKLQIFLFILIIIGIILILTQKIWVPKLVDKIIKKEFKQGQTTPIIIPISITDKNINEKNFKGKTSVISGTNLLAIRMREYINKTISEFKNQSDKEIPQLREKFGVDSPSSKYEIYLDSKYIKSLKTESIVTSIYSFTGGAHGSTIYKVITANLSNGKILQLSNIIRIEKQKDFTDLIKKKLSEWIPEDSDAPVVFTDDISNLKFDSFSNWTIDDKNLIIYFDQYAIGPGVLGVIEFPLPIKDIQNLINPI